MYQTLPPPLPVHEFHRNSRVSLDYELTSSSDESETQYKYRSEEHKFWQAHSSTTIIAPPSSEYDAISMEYTPKPKPQHKQKPSAPQIPLFSLVDQSLGHTFDEIDDEIEKEWEQSRVNMIKSLLKEPKISLIIST